MQRLTQLENWAKSLFPNLPFQIEVASADASFRRYFRIHLPEKSLIIMDAPPTQEDCRPFIHVAELFSQAGVHVPQVLATNLADGFLLLSDLGQTTYLQALNKTNASQLYGEATDALIQIQLTSAPNQLPDYDEQLLTREMQLFPEWYIAQHLKLSLNNAQTHSWQQITQLILQNNLAQPKVFVHRDYHSRNLMVSTPNPGILDFQDAVYGPITYDLVSLFKDAYIEWEEAKILDWLVRYWQKAKQASLPVHTDFSLFYRDFEWMGVQRHLKVLGIFARLYYRDGKSAYLNDIPSVMSALRKACERYRELHPLLRLLDQLHEINSITGYTF